ncbi:ABC-F family ATP-binding cassette domain-containing protein [Derxia gummosa]|uniref:Probable ATP-binding protein YheS n=1 Tax=Derxia gummosa DSM 723 TaxID=1121388 RepID=A0A8B6X4F8_9BURK|nr:ATP-binding cassette domain-containing protein [Derxia gummosa]
MIRFIDLALRRGSKLLFEQVTLQIHPGERVGLVGDNGSGKSSLMALLLHEVVQDAGEVEMPAVWRVAHVAQHTPDSDTSARDFVLAGDIELQQLNAELAAAEAAHDGNRIGDLHARLADHGAYTAVSRAESLLLGLGFQIDQLGSPVSSFSGGWRMRLALAQTLMRQSDLLLLDEPTNHLDLDAIVWLEGWLSRYAGTVIVISHDRDFLDAIARSIWHLDNRHIRRYGGNYSTFERERAQQLAVQQAAYARQQIQVARLESFITRFKAKATKAKQAQSRVKALERMELIAPAHVGSALEFEFATPESSPSPMLQFEAGRCGYGERTILDGVNLVIVPGQRIGLLGANGQGKSTLIKTLVGEIAPLAGTLRPAKGLRIGYFAQYEVERLRPDDTPLDHLGRIARAEDPNVREQVLRDFLGRFDFPGPMATSPIGPFSGGEKARLALACVVWLKPNLLLLDEPTNHLDLETRHALTMALAQFDGTVIVVSHDRHLLRSTVDEFLLVAHGKVEPFDADLDEYEAWLRRNRPNADATQGDAKAGAAKDAKPESAEERKARRAAEADERKRRAEQRKPLEKRMTAAEKAMAAATAERDALDAKMAGDDASLDWTALMKQRAAAQAALDTAEAEWLECAAAIEELDAAAS